MGVLRKLFSKDARGASFPNSIPPPPLGEEMDLPPLPPNRDEDPGLPDLSPGEIPAQAPPRQLPPQEFRPPTPAPVQPMPEPPIGPHINTAEENRLLEEYERTELMPEEQRLPLGAVSTPHAPDLREVIPDRRDEEGPIFVRVDDFRKFIEGQNQIKNNLREADNIITRLNEIKIEEDKQFEHWRLNLEEIQKKIAYVDKKIFDNG